MTSTDVRADKSTASSAISVEMAEATKVEALFRRLHAAWNDCDAKAFAACFSADATIIGFDGSQHRGKAGVEGDLAKIFSAHKTPSYVAKIETTRFLNDDIAIVNAATSLVPRGHSDIDPKLNAIQVMVASRLNGTWQIEVFQNTPAAFHGRPILAQKMSDDLRQVLAART